MRSIGRRNDHLVSVGFWSESFVIFSDYREMSLLAQEHPEKRGKLTRPDVEGVGVTSFRLAIN